MTASPGISSCQLVEVLRRSTNELQVHSPLLSPDCTTMPPLPALSLAIGIPTHHQRLLRDARENTRNIQSLDPETRLLTTLPWYVLVYHNDDDPIVPQRPNSLCLVIGQPAKTNASLQPHCMIIASLISSSALAVCARCLRRTVEVLSSKPQY